MYSYNLVLLLSILIQAVLAQRDYSAYLQPDDIDGGGYDDYSRNPSNICARNCGGPPKTCYYKFEVQTYSAMGSACGNCPRVAADCNRPQCIPADGFRKSVTVVNRRYPGPSIQVCLNDTIVVDVHNTMIGKYTTLHWHGILQRGTPWMDGVYMVTQCPIASGQTFRYQFFADRAGTHYWHDHSGLTKVDGLQSSMVVRSPPTSSNNMNQYDFDLPSHTLFITDWKHFIADVDLPDEQRLNNGKQIDSFLINGKGIYIDDASGSISPLEHYNRAALKTPLFETTVRRGFRYRLRIVGGTCMTCGINLYVDKHKLLIIESDGGPIKPTLVDSLNIFPGERYDVVLSTNQPVDTYWIIVKGSGLAGECDKSYQMGIIRYQGSTSQLPRSNSLSIPSNSLTANAIDGACTNSQQVCLSQLQSTTPPPSGIYSYRYNYRQLIQFGFYQYNRPAENGVPGTAPVFQKGSYLHFYEPFPNVQVRPLVNNISFLEPSAPVLTQLSDIPSSSFCSAKCRTYREPRECTCLDLIKVPLNAILDIIVTDTDPTDGLTHPFHLHGHEFYVLEMGVLGSNYDLSLQGLMRRVEAGNVPVNNPPSKDTVVIHNGGYAILRLIANNPGMWFLHCHFLYHHVMGMSTILQVGDPRQFPPAPAGFPRCQNFYPN